MSAKQTHFPGPAEPPLSHSKGTCILYKVTLYGEVPGALSPIGDPPVWQKRLLVPTHHPPKLADVIMYLFVFPNLKQSPLQASIKSETSP